MVQVRPQKLRLELRSGECGSLAITLPILCVLFCVALVKHTICIHDFVYMYTCINVL